MSLPHRIPPDSSASSLRLSDLYHVGDLVQVNSSGLRAWIIIIDHVNSTCNIRYEIGGSMERNLPLSDLSLVSTAGEASSRSGQLRNHNLPPSARPSQQPNVIVPHAVASLQQKYANLKSIVKASYFHANAKDRRNLLPNPLYNYLCEGYNQPKGWIREIINSKDGVSDSNDSNRNDQHTQQQLTSTQNKVFVTLNTLFATSTTIGGKYRGWTKAINHAFGVCRRKAGRTFENFVDGDFNVQRKQRSDKGSSIFKDDFKRKQTFTAYNAFKRRRCGEYRESFGRIPETDIKNEYEALTEETKAAYQQLAAAEYERSKYLWSELEEFLLKCKGKVSYRTIAAHLGNIVSHPTIISILKQQEGYHTRKDRILPSLDSGKRELRHKWADTFWLFYRSCAAIPTSVAKIVLLHFDEKWFYAAVARSNNKVLTSIGLEPTDYYTRHKSHIHKEMFAVFTAFVLNENDITKGGDPIQVDCVRIGKMLPAKRDSYKRVYRDDGTYHHPHLPENKLRSKGQEYFTNLDLTGSSEGTEKNPKVSLLKMYKERVIAAIEREIIEKYNENGTVRVIVVKQEDGAGAHNDHKYVTEMKRIFRDKGWLIFNQPPQSPITNVHDACIFPMMSKKVSREQAVTFGSTLLKGEQLHETIMKVWKDDANKQAIARAFAGHHQIVEEIRQNKGDNKFLSEKGGLSFGIRRTYIRNEEGTGVVPITIAPQNEMETDAGRILNQQRITGLKHQIPKANDLPKAQLTTEMKEMLLELMDPNLMSDDLHHGSIKNTGWSTHVDSGRCE